MLVALVNVLTEEEVSGRKEVQLLQESVEKVGMMGRHYWVLE